MLLARFSSFLLILVLFLFLVVPIGLALAAITTLVVFVGFCNTTLRSLLEHRESLLSIHSLTGTIKKVFKKNTIDI